MPQQCLEKNNLFQTGGTRMCRPSVQPQATTSGQESKLPIATASGQSRRTPRLNRLRPRARSEEKVMAPLTRLYIYARGRNGTAAVWDGGRYDVPLVGRRAVGHSAGHRRWDDARPDVKTPCRGAASGRRRHGLRPGSHVEQEEGEERNQGGGGVWSICTK